MYLCNPWFGPRVQIQRFGACGRVVLVGLLLSLCANLAFSRGIREGDMYPVTDEVKFSFPFVVLVMGGVYFLRNFLHYRCLVQGKMYAFLGPLTELYLNVIKTSPQIPTIVT